LALAAEGASVVVNDIFVNTDSTRVADRMVGEIRKVGGRAVASYDSVATMTGGQNIVKTATSNFGRIDILVNCAGNYVAMPALETTEEVWDSIMAVHLKGHFACGKAAAVQMAKQKSGRIVNFSSRGSFFGKMGSLAYATAKAGIMGFTALLAKALGEYGITVNCILPCAETKLNPNDIHGKVPLGDHMPLPNPPAPDFVAPVVVYLCTDEARDITGQFIYAGGGDVCIYTQPLQMTSAHRLIRKTGKWTLDELSEIMPSLMGQD
jgi:3-oxoacyl-[acyl-carrier protein] reductase